MWFISSFPRYFDIIQKIIGRAALWAPENAVFKCAHNEICPFGQVKSLRGEIFALQM